MKTKTAIHIVGCLSAILFTTITAAQDRKRYLYEIPLDIDSTTNKVYFEEVIQVPNVSRDELYSRAREWFVRTYKSAEHVLQIDDRSIGKIGGKAWTGIPINYMQVDRTENLHYTIIIYLKDGRYKIHMTDFFLRGYGGPNNLTQLDYPVEPWIVDDLYKKNGEPKYLYRQYKEETIKTWRSTKEDLRKAMSAPSSPDDW